MLQNSNLGRTFLFLTELAWKNRVALPALIMVGCMVFNFRWEIEINIHTERIALQDLPGRPYVGGAFGGLGGTLNGMIRINRYAVVNFHNARR
ncbi:hypothetical protein ZHAS_00016247 [Anopheles sinensis]|uniref:Uncharacterized protein n=1 Tax=Anopheles sinensis TaxID=74873 RepID=A0A084WD85_ANOSI|nr:hypothetical protein ZHAS_00016247 [Anopheles sinensis]